MNTKELEKRCNELFFQVNEKTERIAELEKENAELKEQQFSLRNERNTFLAQNEQYEKDLIDFNENLTKAKEIIKYLLSFIQKENYKTRWDINIAEAEQFLKQKAVIDFDEYKDREYDE